MAEDRPGGEPTEEPTPKRLRDARRKGQVARSRDLTAGAAFLAAFAALWLSAGALVGLVAGFMRRTLATCAGAAEGNRAVFRATMQVVQCVSGGALQGP